MSERRIRLVVEYDGTDFAGWQRQENGPSVQAAIEDAIRRLSGEVVRVGGAGRTDAGVHALGQVASFVTSSRHDAEIFRKALNALLPPSVAVVRADEVPLAFDPRRDARGKLYRYDLWNAPSRSPLRARTSWHLQRPLAVENMRAAATHLVGEHDFAAFRAADCERKTTVRRVTRLAILDEDRPLVRVEIEATAFLKNMVRVIVGTLVDVGRGRLSPDDVARIRDGRDRTRAGPTAPPHGLSLVRVFYEPALAGGPPGEC